MDGAAWHCCDAGCGIMRRTWLLGLGLPQIMVAERKQHRLPSSILDAFIENLRYPREKQPLTRISYYVNTLTQICDRPCPI